MKKKHLWVWILRKMMQHFLFQPIGNQVTLYNYRLTYNASLRTHKTSGSVRTILKSTSIGLVSGMMISTQLASASAEQIIRYNIAAQSLNNALVKFAALSGLELLFTAEMVRDHKAKGLSGSMSAQQALKQLLQGSGITFRFVDHHTVTLTPLVEPETEAQEQKPLVLETINVYGKVEATPETDDRVEAKTDDQPKHTYTVGKLSSATKTDTPIKSVPQSIQALNRSLIDDQQNITISEALNNISGVVPRSVLFTPVTEGTLIRGFRSEQLVDGFTQYYNPGDRESTVNIESIEVLKGSNALLYSGGSGAPVGGIIHINSKLPKPKAFGEAGFKAGSYDFFQPFIDINQPMTDKAWFRITGEYTHSASHIDAIETQRFNINPALTLTNNTTTLKLQGKISRWKQPEYQGLPATGTVSGDFRIRPQTFIGPSNISDSHSESDAVWATLDHKFNDTWSINLKARYAQSEFDEKSQTLVGRNFSLVADHPFTAPSTWLLTNGELFEQQVERSFLGNAQAKFNIGSTQHTFLAGADYSKLDDSGFLDLGSTTIGPVDMANPTFPYPYTLPGPGIKTQFVKNTTVGGYLQLQSDICQRFHLLSGLRLGSVEIDYRNSLLNTNAKTKRLAFLPRIGGVLDITNAISLFASYSEGMRGQPLVSFAAAPEPELSRHIETGIKFDFDGRLSGQLAVYQIDRSQVAINITPGSPFFLAAGRQRSQGFETDLTWQPFDALNILVAYSHTQAKFAAPVTGIEAGNQLAWVPENSGRLWANYRFQQQALKGLSIGFGVYLRSGAFLSNDNVFKTRGYYSFDAAIAYETPRFKIAATAKNITDEDYYQPFGYFGDGQLGGGRVAPAASTSVYVTGSIRF